MSATIPLRRLAHWAYGESLPTEARIDGPIPVMSSGGQTGTHTASNTKAPVIVVGRKGSHGSVWWRNEKCFVIDTAYFIDTPTPSVDLRYLYYVLESLDLTAISNDVGVPGLSRESAYDQGVPPPPSLAEQRRIADFLDDQVGRIDDIIEARQTQAEATTEWVDALWSDYASRFDDQLVPLRRLADSIADGPFGSSLTSAHYTDSGTRVIRLGNIGINSFRDGDQAFIDNAYAETLSSHAVDAGDVVMAGLGDETWPLGRCAVVPDSLGPAIVKADCYRIKTGRRLDPAFTAWYLSSPQSRSRLVEAGRGSTRRRLNTSIAFDALVPVVDRATQKSVVEEFGEIRRTAGSVVKSFESVATKLAELKRSLITAAVSGEFDVSTADGSGVGV